MDLKVGGYSGQIIFAFSKLAKLFFDKGKPHNASLIAGIRAILITLEYDADPEVDITTVIFQMGILLKRSKFLTTKHSDNQLLRKMENSTKERDVRKCSSSPVQSFFSILKWKSSVMSQTSNQSLSLELDENIKKSKNQYQILTNRKLLFKVSNLSKHPIKNLQSTINVLIDQEKIEE